VGEAVPALPILAAILSDLSFALIVGTLLAGRWLGHEARDADSHRLRRISLACIAILVVCHLVRPWIVAANMSGLTGFGEVLSLIPTVLSGTRQGGLWYANTVALVMLLTGQIWMKPRATSAATWLAIAGLGVLAATRAASSHASEAGDLSLAEISQYVHLLATSVWAGAIVVSAFLVVPHWPAFGVPAFWNYSRRLSRVVTWALAILLLTGVCTAWREVHGSVSVLWTHTWGRILLTKVSLVVVALLLGSLTRFRCVNHPPESRRAVLMARLLRWEGVVMALILVVSGLLANTDPGA
jgi:putative copper resistance protein D